MKKHFSLFSRSGLSICGILLMGLLFSACNKDDDNTADIDTSGLMAVNLAPDLAAGVFLSNNNLTPGPLLYNHYTGGYLSVFSGNRLVRTFDFNNSANPVDSATYNFEKDKYYSLFVTGVNGNYRNVIVHDNFDSISTVANSAYIRYINAIPDSSTVTVSISSNGEVTNSNAGYAMVSGFFDVNAGDVSISISNGTTIDAGRTITVEDRGVYTLLLSGIPGSVNADSVQIRYIKNGMLEEDVDKMPSINNSNTQ